MLRNVFLDNFNKIKTINNTNNNNILNNKLILNNKYKINDVYYEYPIDNNDINTDYIELINKNGYFNVDNKGNLNLEPVSKKMTDLQKIRSNICKFSKGEKVDEPTPIKGIETFNNNNKNNNNNKLINYKNIFIILILIIFIIYMLL